MSERTIEQIRTEHYPFMVFRLAEYIRLHGDPAVVQRALHEAAAAELAHLRAKRVATNTEATT